MEDEAHNARLQADIQKSALRTLYTQPEASSFSLNSALEALITLTQRARNVQIEIHQKKFNAISLTPELALWQDIPVNHTRPQTAIPPPNTQDLNARGPQGASTSGQPRKGPKSTNKTSFRRPRSESRPPPPKRRAPKGGQITQQQLGDALKEFFRKNNN